VSDFSLVTCGSRKKSDALEKRPYLVGSFILSVALPFAPPRFSFHGEVMATEKATFGAGCFWGVEATFRATHGVTNATVGYAGGTTDNPTYEDVCSHGTGHAEVVQVEFDPAVVSYNQLLEVFWSNHNPTTLNRQGPDVGDQYRSVIFYHSAEQQAAAEESKATQDKSGRFPRPIVTQIQPAPTFYPAEDYHQRYLEKRGLSHCSI
jgi:peptide-methionine (S)-S-oxide reductase